MKLIKKRTIQIFILAIILAGCKERFEPKILQTNPGLLVVDGFLNNGNDTTFIRLSRTKKISDGVLNVAEKDAQLIVEDESGNPLYFFQQLDANGIYIVPGMSLDLNRKYRLRITTFSGKHYLSDELTASDTPAIDSISWKRTEDGVTIYANTHDPLGKTKYYRWDYTETWQHHPPFYSFVKYENRQISYRTRDELIYDCWTTQNSSELFLASSAKLSEDLIFEKKLRSIELNGIELSIKYSIIVRQYAITETAFLYLENLKKISEQMGSIFDVQPSQLEGNIKSLENAKSEPVLGYLLASSQKSKRIYIKNNEVLPWLTYYYCEIKNVNPDSLDYYFGESGQLLPVDWIQFNNTVNGAVPLCVDCRLRGGGLTKPDFWQ